MNTLNSEELKTLLNHTMKSANEKMVEIVTPKGITSNKDFNAVVNSANYSIGLQFLGIACSRYVVPGGDNKKVLDLFMKALRESMGRIFNEIERTKIEAKEKKSGH